MAINQIGYATKSDISISTIPPQNKITADDLNEIKTVVNTNANLQGDLTSLNTTTKTSVVGSINEVLADINYNLETDGNEVLTGRQVDNKSEYVKRFSFNGISSIGTFSTSLGLTLNDITIIKTEGIGLTNSNNWLPIPMGDFATATGYGMRYQLTNSTNNLDLITLNANFQKAYISIYYTYN